MLYFIRIIPLPTSKIGVIVPINKHIITSILSIFLVLVSDKNLIMNTININNDGIDALIQKSGADGIDNIGIIKRCKVIIINKMFL